MVRGAQVMYRVLTNRTRKIYAARCHNTFCSGFFNAGSELVNKVQFLPKEF